MKARVIRRKSYIKAEKTEKKTTDNGQEFYTFVLLEQLASVGCVDFSDGMKTSHRSGQTPQK